MNHASKVALLCASALFIGEGWQLAVAQEHGRLEQSRQQGREQGREQGRAEGRGPVQGRPVDARGQVLDARHNHGRYYPAAGTVRPSLPEGYRPYYRGRDRFYFSGGIWYAPRGPGFVVVVPPPGLVIGVLPAYYSTVWFGGVPYYYADNVYYTWQPDQNGYAVADPPNDANDPNAASEPYAPPDNVQQDLIIYPKSGQSKDQQAADQFECHTWAKGQTGFDPTQPGGGQPGGSGMSRSNYDRAMSACLTARGYQVN